MTSVLRPHRIFFTAILSVLIPVGSLCAQNTKLPASSSSSGTVTTRADTSTPLPGSGDAQTDKPAATVGKPADNSIPSSLVRWYGQAFVYIIDSTGVRIAMDPFTPGSVKYIFPGRLPADTVLISCEADDHQAGERLFGAPQVFRSYTAVGLNKANGLIFKGVSVNRDAHHGPNANKCTAFVFHTQDGVTFAHLGIIGDTLDSRQRQELGKVDVLFLPVGNPVLSIADLNKIATDLQAKIIVPITYKTDLTPGMNLRTLDEYLSEQKLPIKRLDKSEFVINPSVLPAQPTIYIPALP